jgi:shikimate kinase
MQGLPGSGKSTVAKELARSHGKIIALDKIIVERKKKLILQDQHKL